MHLGCTSSISSCQILTADALRHSRRPLTSNAIELSTKNMMHLSFALQGATTFGIKLFLRTLVVGMYGDGGGGTLLP
jgi:hypothetical protein